jgi:hypothetical protein
VYGGVSARGNGNTADPNIPYNTALRGIQYSDENGVVTFDGIVPGHYTGRAVHIHSKHRHDFMTIFNPPNIDAVLAHLGATTLANGTIAGGTIPQVGQIFLDQTFNNEVYKVAPYSTNTQPFTYNYQDGIMANEAKTSDPILNYVLLGDTVDEGIFGWITVGIDPSNSYSPRPAAHYNGPAPTV